MSDTYMNGTLKVIVLMAQPVNHLNKKEKIRENFCRVIDKYPEIQKEYQDKVNHEWLEQVRKHDMVYLEIRGIIHFRKPKLEVEILGEDTLPVLALVY